VCVTVQSSDKLSSPVGSLGEGLNREPSSEFTFSTQTTAAAAADTNTVTVSQFRSPLLRQMMGNKLAASGRPASATDEFNMSTPSTAVTSTSDDSLNTDEPVTSIETAAGFTMQTNQPLAGLPSTDTEATYDEDDIAVCDEPLEPSPRMPPPLANHNTTVGFTTQTNQPSAAAPPSSDIEAISTEDEIAVCDEPLEPSPRIPPPPAANHHITVGLTTQINQPLAAAAAAATAIEAAYDEDEIAVCDEPLEPSPRIPPSSADHDITSTELAVPVPIEVWTEETAVDPASCEQGNSEAEFDIVDELCIEDQPLQPSPRLVEDTCVPRGPDNNCNSKPDASSTRSDENPVDDRDALCVDHVPSEPSTVPKMKVHTSGKPEECTSVVDEDRDVDTTEALASEVKVDPLLVTMKWNGVEKSHESDWPSTVVNGYPDNDMRM